MKKILLGTLAFCMTLSSVFAFGVMDKIMKSWMGYSIDDVILKWGEPRAQKVLKNKTVYTWTTGPLFEIKKVDLDITGSESCVRVLYTGVDSKVINNWSWDGDGCPGFYVQSKAKQWVNPDNNPWEK